MLLFKPSAHLLCGRTIVRVAIIPSFFVWRLCEEARTVLSSAYRDFVYRSTELQRFARLLRSAINCVLFHCYKYLISIPAPVANARSVIAPLLSSHPGSMNIMSHSLSSMRSRIK